MTIFKMEWHTNKKSLAIWSVSIAIIIIGFMSIFPSMSNSAMTEMMTTKLDTLPEGMLKAFHLNSGPSLVEPTGFFAYVFQYLFIASSMYAIILGNKMLVKEEVEGTIEFLYAQPVSRKQIVLEKGAASIALISLFWLIASISSIGITLFVNKGDVSVKVILEDISKIMATEGIVLIFFLALGLFLSSVLRKVNLGLSMGIVFLFYLMGILGDLKEEWSLLRALSPMAQAGPATVLENPFNFIFISVLLLVSIFLFISTILIYEKKDLNV